MDDDNQNAENNEASMSGHGYCVVPSFKRFILLYRFLKKEQPYKKVMVMFSTCNSVKFHSKLLQFNQIECHDIHGKQRQQQRTATFFNFCKADKGILLCTDFAVRGLDIPPGVDFILQYEPPTDHKIFIDLVNRAARGEGGVMLFLTPEELPFRKYLKALKAPLNEYRIHEMRQESLDDLQSYLENLVASNYLLNKSAKIAYKTYIRSYALFSLKDVFDVQKLNLQGVAASFCLSLPPLLLHERCRLEEVAEILSKSTWFQTQEPLQKEEEDEEEPVAALR